MASQYFRAFLGASRWEQLYSAFCRERNQSLSRHPLFVISGMLLVVCYAAVVLASPELTGDSTIQILLLAFVGGLLWWRLPERKGWFGELSAVHTSFALGVIPALILILFFRESFVQGFALHEGGGGGKMTFRSLVVAIFSVSLFAGVTEEIVFRGVLLSALRRLWADRPWRDGAAIILSGTLFGAFHALLWGPMVGLALVGVGCGLGLGYVASGERLGSVVFYHVLFDILSLSAAVVLSAV